MTSEMSWTTENFFQVAGQQEKKEIKAKGHHQKSGRQLIEWEKIFPNHISKTCHIYNIYYLYR